MRQSARVLFAIIAAFQSATAAAQGLPGQWRGYWARNGDTMAVELSVVRHDTSSALNATFSAERLRVTGIPFAAVQVTNDTVVALTLRGDRTTTDFSGRLRGDSLFGVFHETGAGDGTFAFARAARDRYEVVEREITFNSGSITLAGSILLPPRGDGLVGVVFLHGSGPEGRWASRFLATTLTQHGIAALIYDKRGVGRSTGDWRKATVEDLVGDAVAAVARLRQEPRVNRGRVGIHGHSQGGTLAPLVAARSSGMVRFIIASSAAGTPPDSTELFSILNSVSPAAHSAADSAQARDYVSELVAVAYHGLSSQRLDSMAVLFRSKPWFVPPPPRDNYYWSFSRDFSRYDALAAWRTVRVPVLLIYGAVDQRLPAAESAHRIADALRSRSNNDVTVRIFAGADHTLRLQSGPGGWPTSAPDYLPS